MSQPNSLPKVIAGCEVSKSPAKRTPYERGLVTGYKAGRLDALAYIQRHFSKENQE